MLAKVYKYHDVSATLYNDFIIDNNAKNINCKL